MRFAGSLIALSLIASLIALSLIASAIAADEPEVVGLKKLNADPSVFEGKVVQVRAQVSGTVTEKPKYVWLTVKGKEITVDGSQVNKAGINFVVAKADKELLTGLRDGDFTRATITATVKKEKAAWLAVVTAVDVAGGSGEKVKATVKDNGKPDDVAGVPGKKVEALVRDDGKPDTTAAPTAEVVAEGVGKTKDDALKDAFRNAVRQVVGAMLDADTQVKNEEIISDEVLTYSGGIVKHYDEVSTKEEKGLFRVNIKATVEKTELVAKLKAAKVTIKDVDGKGIFAEVVTDLEAEKNAEALLLKALENYPANVIQADAEVKRMPKDKNDKQVTLAYDLKVSVNQKKYDAFVKRLLPILEKTATAKGVGKEKSEKVDDASNAIEGAVFSTFSLGFRATFLEPIRMRHANATWPQKQPRVEAGKELLVYVNTWRSGTDDELDWNWYLVPISGLKVSGKSKSRRTSSTATPSC